MTQSLADNIVDSVRGYIVKNVSPLMARIAELEITVKELEARAPEKGDQGDAGTVDTLAIVSEIAKLIPVPKDGRDGLNGKDAAPVDESKIVADVLRSIPVPKDGRDGINGIDADVAAITKDVLAKVIEVLEAIPVPKDGRDGIDGKDAQIDHEKIVADVLLKMPAPRDGRDGTNGKDYDPVIVRAFVAEVVAEAVKTIPVPENGRDGKDGAEGLAGKDAQVDYAKVADDVLSRMPLPRDGIDGKNADPVDVEKIALDVLSRMPLPRDGRDGTNGVGIKGDRGQNGRDGFGIEDIDLALKEDGRTLVMKLQSGETEVQREVRLDVPLYKGVFATGHYARGDSVTYGGSLWIAKCDTAQAPGSGSPDWQLAVKRGADSK